MPTDDLSEQSHLNLITSTDRAIKRFHIAQAHLTKASEVAASSAPHLQGQLQAIESELYEINRNELEVGAELVSLDQQKIVTLGKRLEAVRAELDAQDSTIELQGDIAAAHTAMQELQHLAQSEPILTNLLGLAEQGTLRRPPSLPQLVEANQPDFLDVTYTRDASAPRVSMGALPAAFEIKSDDDQTFTIAEHAIEHNTLRLHLRTDHEGKPLAQTLVTLLKIDTDGGSTAIGQATSNERGYVRLPISSKLDDDADYQLILGQRHTPITESENTLVKAGVLAARWHPSWIERLLAEVEATTVLIPDTAAPTVEGTGADSSIVTPDAADLVNDADGYRFDAHTHDDTRCLKARPEISPREYFFTQLVRTEASRLVASDAKDDPSSFSREPVTGPIPMDAGNRRGSDLAVVGGSLVHGKLLTYRQFWSPIGQGLGKLLYSLALAPREEVKLAVIDWRRSERASRREHITAREEISADLERDATINDVVHSSLSDITNGGSEAESSGEATNQPSPVEYLIGGLVGGVFGLAAVHFLRPDTSSAGSANINAWNNGIRSIAASTSSEISDRITQHSSSLRDTRASVVTTAMAHERETTRTRTVRNHNQHHAMTIQYYQVLAHYQVKTALQEERDVVMVPYAIDNRILAKLPTFRKFITAPKSYDISQFILRHIHTLRRVLPRRYGAGLSALERLCYDQDEYRSKEVRAREWTMHCDDVLNPYIDIFIRVESGLFKLRAIDSEHSRWRSDRPVSLDEVRGILFRFRYEDMVSDYARRYGMETPSAKEIEIIARMTKLSFTVKNLSLHATVERTWASSEEHLHSFNLLGSDAITLGDDKRSVEIALATPSEQELRRYVADKRTRQGRDYERVEDVVRHLGDRPMHYLHRIWLHEDAGERALRFDRIAYGSQSLLNAIENRPVGVDGNYVAFPLAKGLRVAPPIDVSQVAALRAVSLPTRGVFAETYLSCNVATEKRDITRHIDESQATPFNAPDIAPISTGSRGGAVVPASPSLPPTIVNYQQPPAPPLSNMPSTLGSLMASSPFPDLSNGEATMAAARSLAELAMTVDADKQKQYLDAAMEIARQAGNAALLASGLPPILGGGGGGGGNSQGAGHVSGTPQGTKATGGSTGSSSEAIGQQAGSALRNSDPVRVNDHLQAIAEAERQGLSAENAAEARRRLLAVPGADDNGAFQQALADENNQLALQLATYSPNKGAIKRALNKLDAFAKGNKTGKWKHVPKATFVADIKKVVQNPRKMNQGMYGLCLMTAANALYAAMAPENYVDYAISIYTTGAGKYGTQAISIKSSNSAIYESKLRRAPNSKGTIILDGALRDHNNEFIAYQFQEDTWPTSFSADSSSPGEMDAHLKEFPKLDKTLIAASDYRWNGATESYVGGINLSNYYSLVGVKDMKASVFIINYNLLQSSTSLSSLKARGSMGNHAILALGDPVITKSTVTLVMGDMGGYASKKSFDRKKFEAGTFGYFCLYRDKKVKTTMA